MTKNKKIVALTTDPYDNLYGYTLVFMRLFDFIQRNNQNLDIVLISNDGVSSKKVNNNRFIKIRLNPKLNPFIKTLLLVYFFVKKTWVYDEDTILIVNAEIPELLAAFILKIKFKRVYCIVQDLRLRDQSLKIKIIHKLRLVLIYRINNVIFSNQYTMRLLKGSIHKFYIGNPIF